MLQARWNLRHIVRDIDWLIQSKQLNRFLLAGTTEVTAELRKGARIEVVRGEASESLINAGGIGAFLRARTATIQV